MVRGGRWLQTAASRPGVEVDVHLGYVLVIAMAGEDHLAAVVLVFDRQDPGAGVEQRIGTGPPPPAVLLLKWAQLPIERAAGSEVG